MTVAAQITSVSYTEDGTTLAFPIPFRFLAPTDIQAQRTNPLGVVTSLVNGTDYTVAGGGSAASGTLTLVASVAGDTLRIYRATPRVQSIDYATNDRFPSETAELGLDRDMLIEQEQDNLIGDLGARALLVPPGESVPSIPPADERAQGILGFDADGNPVILPSEELGSVAVVAQRVEYLASAGQTAFQTNAQYTVGYLGVYVNGVRLSEEEFTATDGVNAVLDEPCLAGDVVLLEGFIGSATASDAANMTFIQKGAGAVTRSAQDKMREIVSLADFGAHQDGVTDDTAAVNAALASLPAAGGTITVQGVVAISARINVTKPVIFEGSSEGSAYQPVEPARTGFKWIGATSAGAMMRIGLYGTGTEVLWGGGLSHLRFDGGGVCAHGLELADASNGEYHDLYIFNTTASGLHLITDGTKAYQPSMSNAFYSLYCDMRAALAVSAHAHGILIEAINGNGAGVTLNYFEDLKINHSGGDGIRWVKGGDGFVFVKPQIYRADSETGWGVNFTSTDLTDICNHNIFLYPIITGGAYFAAAGLHIGTSFIDYDSQNINSGMGINLIQGPGALEVHGNTTFGQLFGQSRLLSNQDVLRSDPMNFMRYDGTVFPAFLTTGQGTWAVQSSGGAAGVIDMPSGLNGGACRMQTQAIANDNISMAHCKAVSTAGLLPSQCPSAQFVIEQPSTAAVKGRLGFFSNNADPPTDGAWVEFDSTVGGGIWRLICANGGTQTVVNNSYGFTAAANFGRWRVDLTPGCANFYFSAAQTAQPQLATLFASIKTNVPGQAAPLFCGVYLKTLDANQKSIDICDIRLAHRIDLR